MGADPVAESTGLPTAPGQWSRSAMIGVVVAVLVIVIGLLWAKWWPYADKIALLSGVSSWGGSDILRVGGVRPGDAPTWRAGTTFTAAYVLAIWKALVVALLVSAALQSLIPRTWLLRVLGSSRRVTAATMGGLVSTPSMMCTCCTAPVAATLRRSGVSTAATVAYWLGNPVLNPAVLVFLFLVAPWQWGVTRLVVGAVLVVGGAALVARLTEHRALLPGTDVAADPITSRSWAGLVTDYVHALGKLTLTLVPEYLLVVFAVGAVRGWLFPLGGTLTSNGILLLLAAAVIGTLVVIPTAGEIPILQGLSVAGLALGPTGALLITLPAISLPSMAMVWRAFGARVTLLTAAIVGIAGLCGAALLPQL